MLVNSGEIEGRFPVAARPELSISPTYFKRTVKTSDLAWATIDFGAKVNLPRPKAAAAKLGLRFEGKVLASLQKKYLQAFTTGVPISFQRKHGEFYQRPETAIPDGLLIQESSKTLLVVEIKLRHSVDAWSQLNRFYLPLLRGVFGNSLVLRTLEICRFYDPGVKLPVEKELVLSLEEALKVKGEKYPVLIWDRL